MTALTTLAWIGVAVAAVLALFLIVIVIVLMISMIRKALTPDTSHPTEHDIVIGGRR